MDLALSEFWRETIGPYQDFTNSGLETVVAELNIRYRNPARYDDELDIEATGRLTHRRP